MAKKHDEGMIKRCQSMYEKGETALEISRRTKLGFSTIRIWAKAFGWNKPHDNRFHTSHHRERCRTLFVKNGFSKADIARHTNIWPGTITRWSREDGW